MASGHRVLLGSLRGAPGPVASAPAVGLSWLLRLRWILLAGQATAVLAATLLFRSPLPLVDLLGLIALGLISNGALRWWTEGKPVENHRVLAATLVFDTALLTGLLQLSGGAANPFSVFYLVQVVLAALLLDTRWALALAAVTSLGFASLFLGLDPHAHHHGGDFSAHLQGMWISYALAASLLGAFVVRVARALEQRERQIAELQRSRERMERLASLGALAAGAAHELGTPLGTILLIAEELERASEGPLDGASLREDARLLRGEATRCRRILDRMAARSEGGAGEVSRTTPADELLAELRGELGEQRGSRLEVEAGVPEQVQVPRQVFLQVLVNLTQNAFDAVEHRGSEGKVRLTLRREGGELCASVEDNGAGLGEEELARLGAPFYTTKKHGKGMGLGLFLSATFAERLGGRLEVESRPGEGTMVRLYLPEEER
jgi:two-component system sensor histidine kinase RegB